MFCRRQVRSAFLSIGVGAVFSLIFPIGKSHGSELVYNAGVGAVIGVAIWICIAVLESLFQATVEQLTDRLGQITPGVMSLVAGFMGWFTGVLCEPLEDDWTELVLQFTTQARAAA